MTGTAGIEASWPVLLVGAPLLGACLALAVPRLAVWAAGLASAAVVTGTLALMVEVTRGGAVAGALGGWAAPLGIALHADGLSAAMLAMVALVGLATMIHAGAYFRRDTQGTQFWPLWLFLWAGLNALFLTADAFNLYVTLEIIGLAAVGLTALTGTRTALQAALRYLLVGFIGSLAYLAGVVLIYMELGRLDLAGLALVGPPSHGALALALMTAGLAFKTALFPLHFWLPPAHANAASPVSALLSGLVVKAGFYAVARLWLDVWPGLASAVALQGLGALGAIAILWGSVQALRQSRLKLLIAYSTVAQIGYLFVGLPLAAVAGDAARHGMVHFALTHGCAKAAMFLAAGAAAAAAGHDRLASPSVARAAPPATLVFALAGVSIMGLPPSGGFIAKWSLLTAAFTTGQWWWIPVMLAGTLLAAAYVLKVVAGAFPGDTAAEPRAATGAWAVAPAAALALAALVLGFAGAPLAALTEVRPALPGAGP